MTGSKYVSSCKAVMDQGLLPASDGVTEVMLKAPTGGKLHTAMCAVVGDEAHTHVKCDELAGGACLNHAEVTADNTCTRHGYFVSPFRSARHWKVMRAVMDETVILKYLKVPGGVHKTVGIDTGLALADGNLPACSPFSSTSTCATDHGWQSIDGGAWWITDDAVRSEPSGDYNAYDYLESFQTKNMYSAESYSENQGFSNFNDNVRPAPVSGVFYLCGLPTY
jgi:hypothetical protein